MPGGEIKLLGVVASAGLSLSSPFVFSQCLFKKSVTGGWVVMSACVFPLRRTLQSPVRHKDTPRSAVSLLPLGVLCLFLHALATGCSRSILRRSLVHFWSSMRRVATMVENGALHECPPSLLHSFCGPWILSLSSRLRQESIFLDSKNQALSSSRPTQLSHLFMASVLLC